MLLFFDTETTGNYDFKGQITDHHQPRICQIAFVVTDHQFKPHVAMKMLIKRDGWDLEHEAKEVNGIEEKDCERFGMPIKQALQLLEYYRGLCHHHIAFNVKFDENMVHSECSRFGGNWFFQGLDSFDPMWPLTKVIGLKQPNSNRAKWPTLAEAYYWATDGGTFSAQHDGLADTAALIKVVKGIQQKQPELLRGVI